MIWLKPYGILCMLLGAVWLANGFSHSGDVILPSALKRAELRRNFQKSGHVSPNFKHLKMTPQSIPTASAIAIASAAGIVCDRKVLESSAIIVTLGLATCISNTLKSVPKTHVFYDYCWSVMLPLSFVLLLISMETTSPSDAQKTQVTQKVGFAFLVASFGSIVGCWASYKLCCLFPSLFGLKVAEAAQVTSCLAASFVGGSVNFFATAATIPSVNRSLLTAMATADVIVMAIYFAGLSLASNAPQLKRLFSGGHDLVSPAKETKRNFYELPPISFFRKAGFSLIVLLLSSMITAIAKRLEYFMAPIVPGTSYAALALAIPRLMRWLSITYKPSIVQRLRHAAQPLSEFTFLSLFASIGASVDLRRTVQSGPSCLAISLIALCCHAFITFLGSLFLIKGCRLHDVLVASNAAIGGPATAAAFGGQHGADYSVAGAVWGIIGYGVGTTLGTTMYRLLVSHL